MSTWKSRNASERRADIADAARALFGREQRGGREREIGKDHRVLREIAGAQRLLALAREHEQRLRADGLRRLEVAHRVADARYAGHVDAEAQPDLAQHPALGLAAVAVGVGGVRAVEQGIDAPADLRERLVHLLVDRVQRRHVEQPAADPRLIRRDDDAKAGVMEACDRLEAARNRPPLVRRLDELLAVAIDDAVAVEHDQPDGPGLRDGFGGELAHQTPSLEMSATRFIVRAMPRSSARRFARIAGSSAMTRTSSKKRSTAGLAVA